MSGGSMNYFYSTLEGYENRLDDVELNDLVHDLAKVFHDKEWADSGDTCEGSYNKTVKKFKDKWFTPEGRDERRTKYIDAIAGELKRSFGVGDYCKDCRNWSIEAGYDGEYGRCKHESTCVIHGYEEPCEKFERRSK